MPNLMMLKSAFIERYGLTEYTRQLATGEVRRANGSNAKAFGRPCRRSLARRGREVSDLAEGDENSDDSDDYPVIKSRPSSVNPLFTTTRTTNPQKSTARGRRVKFRNVILLRRFPVPPGATGGTDGDWYHTWESFTNTYGEKYGDHGGRNLLTAAINSGYIRQEALKLLGLPAKGEEVEDPHKHLLEG